MLYQVAVMKRAKWKDDEIIEKEELVWMSDWFVCTDPDKAAMKAVMDHRDQITCDFDDMEILVRPFS